MYFTSMQHKNLYYLLIPICSSQINSIETLICVSVANSNNWLYKLQYHNFNALYKNLTFLWSFYQQLRWLKCLPLRKYVYIWFIRFNKIFCRANIFITYQLILILTQGEKFGGKSRWKSIFRVLNYLRLFMLICG